MKFIYLIKSENNEGDVYYKIGFSKNPKKRLKQLQTGNPNHLDIQYVYETSIGSSLESALHNHFSYCKDNGEWYSLRAKEVLSFIDICKKSEKALKLVKNNYELSNYMYP